MNFKYVHCMHNITYIKAYSKDIACISYESLLKIRNAIINSYLKKVALKMRFDVSSFEYFHRFEIL